MTKLSKETLSAIREDSKLFAAVADALGIKPVSLPQLLDRNATNLNQYSIVKLVADYLGKTPDEILEEDTVPEGQK